VTLQFEDRIDIGLYLTKMVRYEILLGELLDIDGKLAVFNNVLQVYLSLRCVFSSGEEGYSVYGNNTGSRPSGNQVSP